MNHGQTTKGIAASLIASGLFGVLYYYATLMRPLRGIEIYGWRIVSTLPCLGLLMALSGTWSLAGEIAARIRSNPLFLLPLALTAALLGVQLWLFMWAPLNGMALDVSLGYLLMPLVMAVCGRVVYKELLRPVQKLAILCAAIGVGNQLLRTGSLSWAVAVVAIGFPIYFMLRRRIRTDNLGGLWFDLAFMLPIALAALFSSDRPLGTIARHPLLFALIPLLGVISAIATGCYIIASRLLPMSLFGLLSYMEPVLLVAVSLLLGESIRPGEEVTCIGVGAAVAVLALGGFMAMRRSAKTQ